MLAALLCVAAQAGNGSVRAFLAGTDGVFVRDIRQPGLQLVPTAVSGTPRGLAMTPDGGQLLVSYDPGVVAIDTQSLRAKPIVALDGSGSIAIAPDGATAYVAGSIAGEVTPFDLRSGRARKPVAVGGPGFSIFGLAVTPDSRSVYAAVVQDLSSASFIYRIDCIADTVDAVFDLKAGTAPRGITVSADGGTVFVALTSNDTVLPLNTRTSGFGSEISAAGAPFDMALSPEGKTLYVADRFAPLATPIDLVTQEPGDPLPIGQSPFRLGLCPNSSALLGLGNVLIARDILDRPCSENGGPPHDDAHTLYGAGLKTLSVIWQATRRALGFAPAEASSAFFVTPVKIPQRSF
jgi:DNA-binding beta-propeller fold protein YncE